MPERELWRGGYAWRAAYRTYLLAGLLILGLLVLGTVQPNAISAAWLAVMAAVIGLVAFVRVLLKVVDVTYVLTDQRLIHRRGLFYWRTERMELIDMDDIHFEQGIVDHALDLGRIVIHASDRTNPQLVLDGIARGAWVCETIENARRAERRRRGLFVEAI